MTFPYVEFLGLVEERIFRPMVPLSLSANRKTFSAYGLIDSGSDYTILPIEIASILRLNLSEQPQYSMLGAGGGEFSIQKSPIDIKCALKQQGFRDISWRTHVYFSISGTTMLLGYKGFFDHLDVRLNVKQREIEIH